MMNCTLSTIGFILFVMAFISYYQYCSLSSSLQGMGVWNSMLILLPCASDGVEEGKQS